MKHIIYLGLGSNVGDRQNNLAAAIAAMPPTIEKLHASPIYETPPWGFEDQSNFLNQVVEAQTDLSPKELLDHIKNIESDVGRTPTFRNGPREIDIDILFYDDLIVETETLTIPHARLAERAFMLVPLADLTRNLLHPKLGASISELLSNVNYSHITSYNK